ncbi:hypothetical protein GCM10022235_17080 [Kribbella ginsengisoli]|uniref:Restriction endonuclease n=2 Tax=Kribbella ginsengisoli TaxID=363865 RepID=A0ABP6WH52_9ACTN
MQRSKTAGNLVLLPAIDLKADYDEESEEPEDAGTSQWVDEAPTFQADLLAALQKLSGSKVLERPEWATRYATAEQLHLQSEVVKQQKRVETARAKLAKLQQEKEAAEVKDQLFLGTGRALELEVKAVLEILGGDVTEPEPGRDDWKVAFPEGQAVVEVKGVGKSAAEKHAAQLEKWVAGALEETGASPKGILVVNTWREVPLSERAGVDFPDQMIPYCVSRNHCLVTGLQLFVIRDQVTKDPSQANYWREKLLETAGVVTGCEDWRAIIQESKSDQEA